MSENSLLPEQAPSMFGQPLAARMRRDSSTCWARVKSCAG